MMRKEGNFAESRRLFRGVRAGKGVIAVGLALLLTVFDPAFVRAQIGQDSSKQLQVSVLEGDNSTLDNSHAARLVVEVRDGRAGPVKGADVTFIAPDLGPGAVFFKGGRRLTVKTDARGRATSGLMRPDGGEGPFSVAIAAAFQDQTATATAQQTNKPEPAAKTLHKSGKLKWILIIGAAAAVAVIVLATMEFKGSPPSPQVTLGPPTVGQPQ
jgi:hypothetical protein